ncbi:MULTISPECIES: NUDIX hydrolase [Rhodococcus]|uniref:Hydrolase n=1 Tax=Rhodococcus opacus RKJ300 = JCM 13270 TaxID=1165867 RepID=I0WD23_RHOOP|nr:MULTISPECIES: NUDIX hydrolase [Rhodococcus]EID74289.1 hydrolase [Rhodococcus opacus RKJ300 = JCM 13270]QQZ15802.1 NUDIX hydrolase [Rhodococcus sp. 21391]
MAAWTDSDGKSLLDYPRPSVAVDVAVLTVDGAELKVLVVPRRSGQFTLPGTFLHEGERLRDAAERCLRITAGLTGTEFHQLAMLDDPGRDDRGWVLSMTHGAALPRTALPRDTMLITVDDARVTQEMAFDHADVVTLAVADLRERYARAVDPSGLAGDTFTVLELRRVYEVVFGRSLPKDSFRRHMMPALENTGDMAVVGTGRPAEIYRRGPASLPPTAAAFLAG